MEQCRSVNPFISTVVFYPLKLTDRSYKQTAYTIIRHFFIHHLPCVYVGSAIFVKFLYMDARLYWAN